MFPLDSYNMDKYIFDEAFQTWENYLSNIKKLLNQTCNATNDITFEDKNNKIDKSDLSNISDSISYEEKDEGLFSNDDENANDYL